MLCRGCFENEASYTTPQGRPVCERCFVQTLRAHYSMTDEQILFRIREQNAQHSLNAIRDTVEKIWANQAEHARKTRGGAIGRALVERETVPRNADPLDVLLAVYVAQSQLDG